MSGYNDLRGVLTFAPLVVPPARRGPRERSRFDTAFASTAQLLKRELRSLGAKEVVLEVDIPQSRFRQDGMPSVNAVANSPGVRLRLRATANPGKPTITYDSDHFTSWQDNVRAIARGLESLRLVDRYQIMEKGSQYIGQKALPAGAGESSMNIAEASEFFKSYGVSGTASGLQALRKRLHPDNPTTGDEEAYKRLDIAAQALSLTT